MKLARAEEYFGQLQEAHKRFIDRNPYRALREADPEPHFYVFRMKIVEPPPVDYWSVLVGGCVHALRSALDHTAYELVRLNQPATVHSEFPIFKGRREWNEAHERKLPGVDPKVLTQVKWLQPYRGDKAKDPLWIVHMLDIIDKHRRLNFVNSTLGATAWDVQGGEIVDVEPRYGPFVDGAPVVRFKMVPAAPQMYVKGTFAFSIALSDTEPGSGQDLFRLLEDLRVYVGGVVGLFDRFFV